jgi:hypothetical protein
MGERAWNKEQRAMNALAKLTRAAWANSIATEILGLLLITYGFLAEIPWSVKILIALSISLVLMALDRLDTGLRFRAAVVITQLERQIWFDNLTMRFALNDWVHKSQEERPTQIDWTKAMDQAGRDIASQEVTARVALKYMPSKESGFYDTAFFIATFSFARVFTAYGLAWSAQTYAPHFVRSIT